MKKIVLKNILWREGKFYVAQCLNVDVSSFGKTKREALRNLREAVALYLEDLPHPRMTRVQSPELVETTF